MPWALLIRVLLRIAASMFAFRVASARRGGVRPPQPVPGRAARPGMSGAAAIVAVREGAAIGWRVVSLVVFGLAAAALVSAGATLTVLSPRWLGIALLLLAACAAAAAVVDMRGLLRLLAARRLRRSATELRRNLS